MIAVDPDQPVIVSEYAISARESFRVEVRHDRGRDIVSLSRWKKSAAGVDMPGSVFEFSAQRAAGVAKMMADLEAFLNTRDR